ncbi:MAG: hypothetical protein DRQ55_15350 [Planctomycetota bacterium]|nr:MAG: hypothetical protein DRQ55_15350 [Planctomycetota bacterium]
MGASASAKTQRKRVSRGILFALIALLALHAAQLVNLAVTAGETYDEPMYLMTGTALWDGWDTSLNREHPPLLKALAGLPLALAGAELPAHVQTDVAGPQRFLYELNDDPLRLLFLGRLPMLLLGLALALAVWAFARACAGEAAGLVALVALMLQPALTGNTPLAALDAGLAAFAFFALTALVRLRQAPSSGRTLLAGLLLGAALLTKFTALLLLPVFAGLLLLDAVRERSAAPLLRLAALLLVAGSTLFAGYGFELRRLADVSEHPRFAGADGVVLQQPLPAAAAGLFGDGPVPMLSLLKGLDHTLGGAAGGGHVGAFRGETGVARSWRSFYLVALAVKTPVGVLLLGLLALLLLPWLPRLPSGRAREGPLLLWPALVLLAFSLGQAQLGVRYVLVVCPALAVLVGRLAALDPGALRTRLRLAAIVALLGAPAALFLAFPERGPSTASTWVALLAPMACGVALLAAAKRSAEAARAAFRAVLAVLLLGAALELAAQRDQQLMFFNAYAGGPQQGWRILSVGDDWGQGVAALAAMQQERDWPRLNYQPYGTGVPDVHGLRWRGWGGAPLLAWDSNLVAVHVAKLTRDPSRYELLDGLEPIAMADGVLVFEVPRERLIGGR